MLLLFKQTHSKLRGAFQGGGGRGAGGRGRGAGAHPRPLHPQPTQPTPTHFALCCQPVKGVKGGWEDNLTINPYLVASSPASLSSDSATRFTNLTPSRCSPWCSFALSQAAREMLKSKECERKASEAAAVTAATADAANAAPSPLFCLHSDQRFEGERAAD